MKKCLALLLTLVMVLSLGVTASASGEASSDGSYPVPYEVNIVEVPAEGGQAALETHTKTIIDADGLKFKDLNSNGKLDVYEDWRQDIDARVEDLLSQMTLEEKIGSLFHMSTGGTFTSLFPYTEEFLYSNESEITVNGTRYVPLYHAIISDYNTTFLHNVNGDPLAQLKENNVIQEIGESGRLGIPVVLSCDRSYNTWAGMVNMSNYAFGIAHDEELLYELVAQYAKEEHALGYHVPFHTYGVEIGSWYGDEVNYIAKMTAAETRAYEENGVNACTKHFIARGGRSGYASAKSPANLLDSWMVGWQAAVDAGTSWVMLNNSTALNQCPVMYDTETMSILRNDLGYDGVVVTDWPMWNGEPSARGITAEGEDLSQMTCGQLYTKILEAGVDQFGGFSCVDGTDCSQANIDATYPGRSQLHWPDILKQEVENGGCDIELINNACRRILRNKFQLGLFEDPFHSDDEILTLAASEAYQAEQFDLNTIDDIYAARNDRTNELEKRLQTESTVLLKNDGGILPLAEGAKVYVYDIDEDEDAAADAEDAIAEYGTIVDSMDKADVVFARISYYDSYTEECVEEVKDAGKPLVLAMEVSNGGFGGSGGEPNAFLTEYCDAILMLTYNAQPDHGSAMGNFNRHTLPSVMAEMLFGIREPAGSLVFEIARSSADAAIDWGELGLDTGVDMATRLYMAATVRNDPTAMLPKNLGDVLYPADFGMRYGEPADIDLNTLVMDAKVVTEESASGEITSVRNGSAEPGETFTLYLLAENAGGDGTVMVEAYDGGTLLASKFVSVEGGSFVVVQLDVTLTGAGEHVITVGDNSLTVTVA